MTGNILQQTPDHTIHPITLSKLGGEMNRGISYSFERNWVLTSLKSHPNLSFLRP